MPETKTIALEINGRAVKGRAVLTLVGGAVRYDLDGIHA